MEEEDIPDFQISGDMTTLCLSQPSLFDLCSFRIAYFMWTRHDVTNDMFTNGILFERLVGVVLADVQRLPVPKRIKSLLSNLARPAGKHLLSLLDIWLSKARLERSQEWLNREILFECLVLNGDGLINQRKTAEKLLSSSLLHNVFAFRLACVNFLEREVLKLWPSVELYFLNKVILDTEQLRDIKLSFRENNPFYFEAHIRKIFYATSPCTTEPYEVLYWIQNIALKVNKAFDREWMERVTLSGNAVCFDYFKNHTNKKPVDNHVQMIKYIFHSDEEEHLTPCFIYHFSRLYYEEQIELFQISPRNMVIYFLQWPLSLTFVQNLEEVWNLIPDQFKSWVFLRILAILFDKHWLIHGLYNNDHLINIFVSLWKISLDSLKTFLLNEFIFRSQASIGFNSLHEELREAFENLDLKAKLFSLFLSSGEAVLDLFEGVSIKESLRKIIAEHMPEDFDYLNKNCISFLPAEPYDFERDIRRETYINSHSIISNNFLLKIKRLLFSSNSIDKTYFYDRIQMT